MDELMRRYADVILDAGLDFRRGQCLAIDALPAHAPLACAVAEQAYRRGAHYVDVWYFESQARAARIRHATPGSLSWTPPWLDERYRRLGAEGGALVRIVGDPHPDLLSDLDSDRVGLDRMPALAARLAIQLSAAVSWTIACYPTAEWAERVFGAPDVDRLWRHVERIMRLDDPDPVGAWQRRLDRLQVRADLLTGLKLDSVRFVGPGTELIVGLIPGGLWTTSRQVAKTGQRTIVNLPTEEVFTAPQRNRADGVVTCTRPLVLGGTVVRDLELTFAAGRVTRVRASSGAEAVRALLAADPAAARLGEVALVDSDSVVGQSGVVYFDTLLDENATCHLALGAGIPNAIPGWLDLSADQLAAAGVNVADTHIDFMVGGPEVTVTGQLRDGTEIALLRQNRWQPAEPDDGMAAR